MCTQEIEWDKLSPEEKKTQLYLRQKKMLETFLEKKSISKEQFERIQTRLDFRKKTKHKKYSWLLNGLVVCKQCGTKMTIKVIRNKEGEISQVKIFCGNAVRKSNKTECDRKFKAINEDVVNKIVISNVEEKLNKVINNEKLEEIITNQYNQAGTKVFDDNIQILQKQLEKTEKTISSLYEDYKNGILETDDYKRFYKTEGEKRVNLKSQIDNLVKQKESRPIISEEKLLSVVRKLSNIKEWDREKLSEIIYNIEIDKENNIYINYKYDVLSMV